MFKITEYTVEAVADPFKILVGERYEFLLDLDVEEDDELYLEEGVKLRVVLAVQEDDAKIAKYEFQTGNTGKYIDIEMEDEELEMVTSFCKEHYNEQ